MAKVARRIMTLAEFLEWDDGTDRRYELIRGEPRAMAPPEEAHGAIVMNIGAALRSRLEPRCRIIAEAGIVPSEADDSYYQADLAVTCSPPEPGRRYLIEPVLIVEVLSPSTAEHDRGAKMPAYRNVASVREILLVSSRERHVEHWTRAAQGWHVQDFIGDAELPLALTGAPLMLAAVYDNVALEDGS